ncbi:hypothetical protein RND81_07G169800 [Saponaria officinalis]|uniref:Nuclear pore complex protein NUP1-like n=1 Tax=Saponaria officinalis TaxID=3572 RepID=A0AAW1JSY9_SAPOF
MASAAYGGINGSAGGSYSGAGGKFRKRPFRKPQTTPYDRPPTAVRQTQSINNQSNNGGWLSKIVDPASKLITAGAHKLFSSVFRKRLLPPPQQTPVMVEDEGKEITYVRPEAAENVVATETKIPAHCGGNVGSMPSNSNGVAELEDILKQKTFTRSEIDHLTALLLSRTVENSDGAENSDMEIVHTRRDKLSNLPGHENRFEYAESSGILTPEVRSKVLPDNIASPAEIAKAYMGSRPTKPSPSVLPLQSQLPKEDLSTPSNPLSMSLSPVKPLTQNPVSDMKISSNGFITPRFRGRSAIYSMARTPYSRFHPVTTSKADKANLKICDGSYLNATENNPSKKQVLKRRSSVLENDIGSVGPMRRIRQKPNLLHPKTLSLPPPGGRQVMRVSGVLSVAAEAPPSMEQSSHSFSKVLGENSLPGTSSGYVPSQSIEMAQKIFEQLDKFSPKGRVGKNVDIAVGISPTKTPGTGSLDSLKPLQGSQDNKNFTGSMDFVHARDQPQTSSMVDEVSAKTFVSTSAGAGSQGGAESRKAGPYISSKLKAAENVMSVSVVDRPQKRAFQMSAHEDCLEMDDDSPSNEVALPTPLTEERKHAESPGKTVAFPDSLPRDHALAAEKPPAMKTTTQLRSNGVESLVNGSSASETSTGFQTSVVSLSSPASNISSTVMDGIGAPQSILNSNKVAPQNETSNTFAASSSKSDIFPPFIGASPSSAKDSQLGTPVRIAAEVNGPDKSDSNGTPVFGNTIIKFGESHSVGPLSNGSQANNTTPVNGVLGTLPAKADASFPVSFTSSSNIQNSVPVSVSSPSPSTSFKVSNGGTQPTFTTSTSTPATSSMDNTDKLGAKSHTMSLGNAASSLDAKASAFGSEGNNISTNTALVLKNTSSESNKNTFSFQSSGTPVSGSAPSFLGQSASSISAPASTSAFSFSGQSASSGSAPVSTSAPIFSGQAASSALVPASTSAPSSSASPSAFVFGSSGSTGSSSGSIFGSLSSTPFSSGSGTVSSVLGTSSSPTSSPFGFNSQSPKPTPTTAAPSASPVFSFGLGSTGTTSTSVFGATTSSPAFGVTASSSVFGTTTSSPAFGATTSSPAFGATTSSPAFGTSTSSPAFGTTSTSSVFGAATSSPAFGATTSSPAFGATSSGPVFGATISSSASNSTPFVFGGNSALAASSPFQSQPAFNNATSQPFMFGSSPSMNSDQMTMEDTMAEDSLQPSTPATPTFGAPLAAPSGGFGFNATPAAASPFQFNTQPNQITPQNPSFQPSGSLEFNGGTNSFSLGTSDKSQRRIVRVKKGARRK